MVYNVVSIFLSYNKRNKKATGNIWIYAFFCGGSPSRMGEDGCFVLYLLCPCLLLEKAEGKRIEYPACE
jgi:hypothetical protein